MYVYCESQILLRGTLVLATPDGRPFLGVAISSCFKSNRRLIHESTSATGNSLLSGRSPSSIIIVNTNTNTNTSLLFTTAVRNRKKLAGGR